MGIARSSLAALALLLPTIVIGEPPAIDGFFSDTIVPLRRESASPFVRVRSERAIALFGGLGDNRPLAETEAAVRQEIVALERDGLGETPEFGELIDYLLEVLARLGRYPTADAREWAERSVRVKESTGAAADELADSLQRLGKVLEADGEYRPAVAAYERALGLMARPQFALCLRLAGVLTRVGDYGAARRMLELAADNPPVNPKRPPQLTGHVANLASAIGDHETALVVLDRAEELPPIDSPRYWLHNLALVASATGDHARARRMAESALAKRLEFFRPEHPLVTHATHNLAAILARAGEYGAARRLLQLTIERQQRSLRVGHPDLALSRLGLANLLTLEEEYDRSGPLYALALPALQRSLDGDDPYLPFAMASAAWYRLRSGDAVGAMQLAPAAERLSRRHFRAALRGMSEREALRHESVRTRCLSLMLSVLAGGALDDGPARDIWDELIRSRAMVLDEMATRQRAIYALRDPRDAAERVGLTRARHRLATLAMQSLGSGDSGRLASLLREAQERKEVAERALAAALTREHETPTRPDIDLAEVAAHLPPRTALVSFVRYEHLSGSTTAPAYLAMVLAEGRPPRALSLGAASRIDERIAEWREVVASDPRRWLGGSARSDALYRERSRELRRAIWDPIRSRIGDADAVFVVPDGNLQLVNFATLSAEDGGYLLEHGPRFHYLAAERDLIDRVERRRAGTGLLVLGDPDFDARAGRVDDSFRSAPPRCNDLNRIRFDRLPGTSTEVEAIRELFGSGESVDDTPTVLTGLHASETEFKRSAPAHRFVHVATHGFFFPDRCSAASASDHPLVLSGLALAGANRRLAGDTGDDGMLTAEEIASLDLSGVEWIVLSACETGVGRVRPGEGVLGLRRALEIAGARSTIMSLWRVEDQSTALWMESLYTRRLEGHSTAEAVRLASLTSLKLARERGRSDHPFGWGAFVASGDWR